MLLEADVERRVRGVARNMDNKGVMRHGVRTISVFGVARMRTSTLLFYMHVFTCALSVSLSLPVY